MSLCQNYYLIGRQIDPVWCVFTFMSPDFHLQPTRALHLLNWNFASMIEPFFALCQLD